LLKLLISSALIDKEGKTVAWKVKNPSAADITFYWNLEGTGQLGSGTIGPGEEIILTESKGGPHKLIVSVPGVLGYDIVVLAAQLPTPTPVPTTSPAPTTGSVTSNTGTNAGSGTMVGDASTSIPSPSPAPTVVSNASNTSPIGLSQLPQTGEQAPYGVYLAGGLLALLGAYFLRRKARS
jgi:LPXTG-motif cell wall-anchored protein